MKVGQIIKSMRELQGKSIEFVANVLNLGTDKYLRLEDDASEMTIKQLETIANALSVSIVDLVEKETPPGQIKNYFFNHAENKGVNINVQGINQEEIRKSYRELYREELNRIPKLEKLLRDNYIQLDF